MGESRWVYVQLNAPEARFFWEALRYGVERGILPRVDAQDLFLQMLEQLPAEAFAIRRGVDWSVKLAVSVASIPGLAGLVSLYADDELRQPVGALVVAALIRAMK